MFYWYLQPNYAKIKLINDVFRYKNYDIYYQSGSKFEIKLFAALNDEKSSYCSLICNLMFYKDQVKQMFTKTLLKYYITFTLS